MTDQPAPPLEKFERIKQLATQLLETEATIARLKGELEAAEDEAKALSEDLIPTLMDELETETFDLRNGLSVKIKETVRASIKKGQEPRAFEWLESIGQAAVIQTAVVVDMGKGPDVGEKTKNLAETIIAAGHTPEFEKGVNAQTLSALVRQRLSDGEPVPEEPITIFRQRAADVGETRSRKRKKKDEQ